MPAVSTPSRKKSWQTGRKRVSVLAALAIKRDAISRRLLKVREDNRDPGTGEKLTQEDAALRVGVRARTWQRWEAGETVPYPRNLASIADAFGFDVAEFFDSEPGSVSDTPDLIGATSDDGQLGRLEERLDRLVKAFEKARKERDDQASEVQRLLKQQSELLETIRAIVAGLGVPDGVTIEDHLVRMLHQAAAQTALPPEPPERS